MYAECGVRGGAPPQPQPPYQPPLPLPLAEDPRQQEWRCRQEEMLRQYLATAESDLRAKRELVDIKQQRLHLAQDEYNHLNTTLSTLSASTTSCKWNENV